MNWTIAQLERTVADGGANQSEGIDQSAYAAGAQITFEPIAFCANNRHRGRV